MASGFVKPLVTVPNKTRRSGWKGWVLTDEPYEEPESLIKLDAPREFAERRTRSGRSFDAIAIGGGDWVSAVPTRRR